MTYKCSCGKVFKPRQFPYTHRCSCEATITVTKPEKKK